MNSSKQSVRKKGILITICTIFLISCNKNESSENIEQLKEKFNGKYEVISSISKDSVDLNMDGITSTNLLEENSEILKSEIEIKIFSNNSYLFEEIWPVEYISIPRGEIFDSTSYHSTYSINYALYINIGSFQFDNNYKSIRLLGNLRQDEVNTLISIESISIEENELIKVVTIRKLYTIKGWIRTRIESQYKRYTNIT